MGYLPISDYGQHAESSEKVIRTIDDIVHLTEESFVAMNSLVLEENFFTLQRYMEASLSKEGDKDYKEPLMSEKKLRS